MYVLLFQVSLSPCHFLPTAEPYQPPLAMSAASSSAGDTGALPSLDDSFGAMLICTFMGFMYVLHYTHRVVASANLVQALWTNGPPNVPVLQHVQDGYTLAEVDCELPSQGAFTSK